MKRLRQFITEEWTDSIKKSNKTFDIFVNPTTKDISELKEASYGYRLLLDLNKKLLYVTDGDIYHYNMFDNMESLNPQDYTNVLNGVQNRYFTCGAQRVNGIKFEDIISDTFESGDIFSNVQDNRNKEEVISNLEKMLKKDWSFFSKWIDIEKCKKIIQRTIEDIEGINTNG